MRVICGNGMPPAPRNAATKLPDDHAENSTADSGDDEEQQPSFEVIEFFGFFHMMV